jgi:hypothetical protein
MIQKNKFIYLRYVTKQTNKEYSSPILPKQPVAPTLLPTDPFFQQAWSEYGQANNQYQADLIKYKENKKNQNKIVNNDKINETEENEEEAVKLFANNIKFGITLGIGSVSGLSQADYANWYMKPITISISGVSIVSSNPMLDSDNIIINIYNKFKKYLSESTFNYYQKPQFLLHIDNGVPGLDNFTGIIKDFNFDESADFPDKFNYSLSFEGKPNDQNIIQKASDAVQSDINSTNTSSVNVSKQTAISTLGQIKV